MRWRPLRQDQPARHNFVVLGVNLIRVAAGLAGHGTQDVGVGETVGVHGRGERERGMDSGNVGVFPHVTYGQRSDSFRNVESLEARVVTSHVDTVGTIVDETQDSLVLVNGPAPHVGARLVLQNL